MADNDHQNPNDPHKDEDKKDHEEKSDLNRVKDKYDELKSDPKVKATGSFLNNYFVEVFYIAAVAVSFIITLIKGHSSGAVVFTGIGFLLGLFLFSLMKNAVRQAHAFITKQELVIHIIVSVIAIILAIWIPQIIFGALIGIPAGFAVRRGIFDTKTKYEKPDDHKDDHKH